jgi:hypothetical protein
MKSLLRYLELVPTTVGLLIVAAVFFLFRRVEPWKAAAVCAVAVGVLHGIIFFTVRAAQRRARNEALALVRKNLDDLIRNKMKVVLCATESSEDDWCPVVRYATLGIEELLDHVKQKSLIVAPR